MFKSHLGLGFFPSSPNIKFIEGIIVRKITATFREERFIAQKFMMNHRAKRIDHFTVVYSVTWPLNGSKAEGLALIQTSLLLLCKCT